VVSLLRSKYLFPVIFILFLLPVLSSCGNRKEILVVHDKYRNLIGGSVLPEGRKFKIRAFFSGCRIVNISTDKSVKTEEITGLINENTCSVILSPWNSRNAGKIFSAAAGKDLLFILTGVSSELPEDAETVYILPDRSEALRRIGVISARYADYNQEKGNVVCIYRGSSETELKEIEILKKSFYEKSENPELLILENVSFIPVNSDLTEEIKENIKEASLLILLGGKHDFEAMELTENSDIPVFSEVMQVPDKWKNRIIGFIDNNTAVPEALLLKIIKTQSPQPVYYYNVNFVKGDAYNKAFR